MNNLFFLAIVVLILLVLVGVGMFALGTRAVWWGNAKCHFRKTWWFGWWTLCRGSCKDSDEDCVLLWKYPDDERWQDENKTGEKYNENKEYKCVCRRKR